MDGFVWRRRVAFQPNVKRLTAIDRSWCERLALLNCGFTLTSYRCSIEQHSGRGAAR